MFFISIPSPDLEFCWSVPVVVVIAVFLVKVMALVMEYSERRSSLQTRLLGTIMMKM